MNRSVSFVIIDQSSESIHALETVLQSINSVSIEGEANDFATGYELIKDKKPSIVVLNVSQNEESALKVAEKISAIFPETTLFITSSHSNPDLIIRSMRAGAREFLKQPYNKEEIANAIKTYVKHVQQNAPSGEKRGKVISVLGVKGGVGTTTIAVNLAVATAEHTKADVILIDLNLQLGNAALFLNLKSRYSIMDVAKHVNDLDVDLLKEILPRHISGVNLLAGPTRIEDADSISESNFMDILTLLKSQYHYIIIDTNSSFDEVTVKALDESDHILVISNPELTTVYNTRRCLSLFEMMGYDHDKVRLILNRNTSQNGIDKDVVEKTIKYPIFKRIPNQDYNTVIRSINEGKPITLSSPKSKLSESIVDIAHRCNGVVVQPDEEKKGKKPLFKSLLKQRS